MSQYILKRLGLAAITMLLSTSMAFFILNVIPGDVVQRALGDFATPERTEALRAELGLDDPVWQRYLEWLWGAVRLDLGNSFFDTQQTVLGELIERAPPTFELAVLALILGLAVGVPAGIISAIRPGSVLDYIVRPTSIIGLALPGFWVALLILILPSLWWNYAPPRYVDIWEDPLANLQLMAPASLGVGLAFAASISRLMRATMLEVIREDYVRTAWSKGLAERTVIARHAIRNALLPVMTLISLQFALALGGTVIVEQIFGIPGVGSMAISAITARDYALVQGFVVMMVVVYVGVNLAVDVAAIAVDPRVRLS